VKKILVLLSAFLLPQAVFAAQFVTDGFDYPVDFPDGPDGGVYVTTQEFLTPGPCGGGTRTVFHPGDDYDSPGPSTGEPIQAAGGGIIVFAQEGFNNGYGNLLIIGHVGEFRLPDDGGNDSGETVTNPQTVYAHLDSIGVNPRTGLLWQAGETILRGEEVGKLGGTPNYVPHLHFEVRKNTNLESDKYPCGEGEDWVKERYTHPLNFIALNRSAATGDAIIDDDFNSTEIQSTWTYEGIRVTQESGLMKVETQATDNGGILYSRWFEVSSTRPLVLRRKVKIHHGSSNSSMTLAFEWEGRPDERFGVYYMRYNYQMSGCLTESFFLFRENGRAHKCDNNRGQLGEKVSEPFIPVWDEWFDERIVYHPDTGDAEYYQNDILLMNWNFHPQHSSRPRLRITVSPWGWFTGHYQHMDWLEISN
jgi:murein DD-endopeptidase MepM/ murein hydrolase activator NlpD